MSPLQVLYDVFRIERVLPFLRIYCPFRAKFNAGISIFIKRLSLLRLLIFLLSSSMKRKKDAIE